jgi:hypothetical protein
MARAKHEVLEIISVLSEVAIDAAEWTVEDLREFASVGRLSNTKIVVKNTNRLSYDDLRLILDIQGSIARNKNVSLEL